MVTAETLASPPFGGGITVRIFPTRAGAQDPGDALETASVVNMA